MEINLSWKYDEVVRNLRTLKNQYKEILASFSYTREENKFIREIKDKIYSFNFDETKIDRIWEYINDDLTPLDAFIIFRILE